MNGRWTKVTCTMTDCLYHNKDPHGGQLVYCSHADKPRYMEGATCPLYRMDWQKKSAMAQNLVKMLKR
jgi:hypothetical protein